MNSEGENNHEKLQGPSSSSPPVKAGLKYFVGVFCILLLSACLLLLGALIRLNLPANSSLQVQESAAAQAVLAIESHGGMVTFDDDNRGVDGWQPPSTPALRIRAAKAVTAVTLKSGVAPDIPMLVQFANLQDLHLNCTELNKITFESLPVLPVLARLTLENPVSLADSLASLSRQPKLTSVSIYSAKNLAATDLSQLKHLPRLSTVIVYETLIQKAELQQLLDLPHLTHIQVHIPEWATDGDYHCTSRKEVEELMKIDYLVPSRIEEILNR